MRPEAFFVQDFGSVTSETWHPCEPLVCIYRGQRHYHGSAAFVFLDGRAVVVGLVAGLPGSTSNDVLAATMAAMKHLPVPTSMVNAHELFDIKTSSRVTR